MKWIYIEGDLELPSVSLDLLHAFHSGRRSLTVSVHFSSQSIYIYIYRYIGVCGQFSESRRMKEVHFNMKRDRRCLWTLVSSTCHNWFIVQISNQSIDKYRRYAINQCIESILSNKPIGVNLNFYSLQSFGFMLWFLQNVYGIHKINFHSKLIRYKPYDFFLDGATGEGCVVLY